MINVPYLRAYRTFPADNIESLSMEASKGYIDTALAVNARTIGIFPPNVSAITGETWFISQNRAQQGSRKIYTFTTTANIPHGITLSQIERFVRIYGTYTDGTNWYSITPTSSTAIAGQVGIYVTSTNIVFTLGAGAPVPTNGTIVLEWLSFP
jgi:hypothetical protein